MTSTWPKLPERKPCTCKMQNMTGTDERCNNCSRHAELEQKKQDIFTQQEQLMQTICDKIKELKSVELTAEMPLYHLFEELDDTGTEAAKRDRARNELSRRRNNSRMFGNTRQARRARLTKLLGECDYLDFRHFEEHTPVSFSLGLHCPAVQIDLERPQKRAPVFLFPTPSESTLASTRKRRLQQTDRANKTPRLQAQEK